MKMTYRHLIKKILSILKITIYSWIAAWKDGRGMADNKENQIELPPNINQQIPKNQNNRQKIGQTDQKMEMKTTTVNKTQIPQQTQT